MPKAKPSNATKPRQFRLAEATLKQLDRIAKHYGLTSRTDAIRVAASLLAQRMPAEEKNPKTERKTD